MNLEEKINPDVLVEITRTINNTIYMNGARQTKFHPCGKSLIDSIGFIDIGFDDQMKPVIAFVSILIGTSPQYLVAIIQALAKFDIEDVSVDYFLVSDSDSEPEILYLCLDDAFHTLKTDDNDEDGPLYFLISEFTEMYCMGSNGASAYLDELQALKKAQIKVTN